MMRLLLRALSPSGSAGRLSILIFHRVVAQPDELLDDVPDAARFERTMLWVREWFNVLPLREAVERIASDSLPSRALAITFDDGYADNESIALPILARLGLTATFFVSSAYVDSARPMWNDTVIEAIRMCRGDAIDLSSAGLGAHRVDSIAHRRSAIQALLRDVMHLPPAQRTDQVDAIAQAAGGGSAAPRLMLTPQQVQRLHAAGMTIGGHTVTHPILTRLETAQARREIVEGRERLEELIGERVELFAYPCGKPGRDYSPDHVAMVRSCGFKAAVSTAWGSAGRGSDLWQLPRFTPWDRERWRFGLRLAQNLLRRRYATA